MMRCLLVLTLISSGLAQSETEVLNNAQLSVDKFCAKELSELDRDAAREDLEVGAGQDNFIYVAVTQTASGQSLATTLQEAADPGFIIGKAFAVVLSIILLVLWILCCWFICCPCCMRCCCKCCQKKRTIGESRICQVLLWLIFIGLGVAAVVLVSLSLRGATQVDEGFAGTFCAAAELVQDSVAGTDTFVGLLPAIGVLETLVGVLNPGSAFMNQVDTIVGSTVQIELAYSQVAASIKLLEDIVSNAENLAPTGFHHRCVICQTLFDILNPVRLAFGESLGTSIRNSRKQVDEQLQGQKAQDLQSQIQAAMAPVRTAKDQLLEQVGALVDPDGFQKNTELVYGDTSQLQPAVLLLFFISLIIVICGFLALGGFCCKHKPSERDEDHTCVRCCPCCVSCGACAYSMLVLLIGGILVIVTMVGSGVCLVLIDFNQEIGEELFQALDVQVDANMEMAITITDRCLSLNSAVLQADPDASTNLADIVQIANESNPSQMVSVRDTIYGLAVTPIETQFATLSDTLNSGGSMSVSNLTEVNTLITQIASVDMYAAYLPVEDMLPAYQVVSLKCADATVGGQSIPGMNSMVQDGFTLEGNAVPALTSMTTASSWTCPTLASYTCNSLLPAEQQNMCEASAKFVQDAKTPLINSATAFKCRYFQKWGSPAGTPCNIRDMYKDVNGNWVGACVNAQGEVQKYWEDCSLAELQTNIRNVAADMTKGFEYFDDIVVTVLDSITQDMIQAVNQNILEPLQDLLSGFDCTFMRSFWQGLTDSLCYRSMNGFRAIANSYVWVAILSLVIAMLMYIPWRLMRDNYDVAYLERGATQQASV